MRSFTLLIVFAVHVAVVQGTGYRFGTWSWSRISGTQTRHYIVQSYTASVWASANVGDTIGEGILYWGDGQTTGLSLTVTYVNLVEDYVIAESTLHHTYPSATNYTAYWNSCCRSLVLQNNANLDERMFVDINLAINNNSPISNIAPIMPMGQDNSSPFCIQLDAVDPDGDNLTFSFAAYADWRGNQPLGQRDFYGNQYCWYNQFRTNGLYSTAVIISDGKSRIMVDFLIKLTYIPPPNHRPVWYGRTPNNLTEFSAPIGHNISFSLYCYDPDDGAPANITSTTALPIGASLTTVDPQQKKFFWSSSVPTVAFICFECIDRLGATEFYGARCVTLKFNNPCCETNSGSPTLSGLPDASVSLRCEDAIPAIPTVTATPVCPTPVSSVFVTPTIRDSGAVCNRVITRTWAYTDVCGRTTNFTQTIAITDTTPPTISADPICLSPPNGQYYCFDTTNPDFVHSSDSCIATTTLSYNNDCSSSHGSGCVLRGNQLCLRASTDGTNDVTYTFSFGVRDSCGNIATQVAYVTVPNHGGANCRTPTVRMNDCAEQRCEETVFDLVAENTGDVVGHVAINNKLNYELQVEVITNEGTIPDRGWWMFNLAIVVGNFRIEKSFGSGSAQSRWYETVDLNRALSSGHECGDSIDVFVATLVTNDKRSSNPPTQRAFLKLRAAISKRTVSGSGFQLPANIGEYTISYNLCCECTIRTQTQNDYGNLCLATQATKTTESARERAIACYEYNFWTSSASWCFPNGLTIGCSAGYTARWSNPTAAASYWADETSPRALTQSWVDPPTRSLGYLAAETAALALNVRFDTCDANFATSYFHLEDLRVCEHPNSVRNECRPWWGQTVSQILAEANQVVGGCRSGDVNALFQCVRYINRAFVDGKRLWETPDFTTDPTC